MLLALVCQLKVIHTSLLFFYLFSCSFPSIPHSLVATVKYLVIVDISMGGENNVQSVVSAGDGDPGVTSITFTRPLGNYTLLCL